MTRIFVLCSGQDDNIGDVVLRRKMLSTLREHGQLHIYLGSPSSGFLSSLLLDDRDITYSSMKNWRAEAYKSLRHSAIWFVDKPGELQMSDRALLAQIRLLPLAIATRLRGGKVLRLGIGQRSAAPLRALVVRCVFAVSNLIRWRDSRSKEAFGLGQIMPDWGLGDTGPGERPSEEPGRRRLVLSYRADRPKLSETTIAAIRTFATELGLQTTVVCQVRRDEERSTWLANELSADVFTWPSERSHFEQEVILRTLYRESAMVLSDRLHVLIVAMTEGAVPACITDYEETKISRHFEAIGYLDLVSDVRGQTGGAIIDELRTQVSRSAESRALLESAKLSIQDVSDLLTSSVKVRG